MCDLCETVTCVNDECINLTDEDLCKVMGFSMEEIQIIKKGEEARK